MGFYLMHLLQWRSKKINMAGITFVQSLIDCGYSRVGMVIEQGTYSVKVAIVDVFPSNHNPPIELATGARNIK